MTLSVRDAADRQRFEILADGEPVGFAAYRLRDGAVVITHTQTDPAHRGEGLGGELARLPRGRARLQGNGAVRRSVNRPFP